MERNRRALRQGLEFDVDQVGGRWQVVYHPAGSLAGASSFGPDWPDTTPIEQVLDEFYAWLDKHYPADK